MEYSNSDVFNIEILNTLATHHRKIMKIVKEKLIKLEFKTNKELYDEINDYMILNKINKAFPIGISINNIIAHDSWHPKNLITFSNDDFIKVDIGMEQDGHIIDSARTIQYNNFTDIKLIDKSITDCKEIVKEIEKYIRKEIELNKKILVQKISIFTNIQIVKRGYKSLDNLGGHNIKLGQVHGGKLILNKPLKLLPEIYSKYINSTDEIGEGEMFAIEVYISDKKIDGSMICNTILPITHFELNKEADISKLNINEIFIFNEIKKNTKFLPYEFHLHNNFDIKTINNFIKKEIIKTHLPIEWKDNKQKIKYVQYEDCYIILNGELINLMSTNS
jgi:methionine aminopeptidase